MIPSNKRFVLDIGWQILLNDLVLSSRDLLRHARLPLDLFNRNAPTLTPEDFFRLWHCLEHLLDNPASPLMLGQSVSVEAFSPPIFACFCSPNLNTALARLSKYKRLMGPLRLDITAGGRETVAVFGGLPDEMPPPPSMIATELVFLVHMARLATRENVVPARVFVPTRLAESERFEAFFGTAVSPGPASGVSFRAEDALKPFLTTHQGMWPLLEPQLQSRLRDLSVDAGFRARVRACLVEVLASGQFTMSDMANRLAVSTRTLQRRLRDEGTNFQNELVACARIWRATISQHPIIRARRFLSSSATMTRIPSLVPFVDGQGEHRNRGGMLPLRLTCG
jgi:AraC-like DNA-binding protein